MSYVFWNIWWCLVAAALLGGLIGWLIKHFVGSTALANLRASLESERDQVAASAPNQDAELLNWKNRFAALEAEHVKVNAEADKEWMAREASWDSEKSTLTQELQAAVAARSTLEAQVKEWTSKGEAWAAERSELSADVDKWRFNAGECNTKLSALLAAEKSTKAAYDKQLRDLKLEHDGMKQQISRFIATGTAYEAQLGEQKAQLNRLQSDLAATRTNKVADADYEKRMAELKGQLLKAQGDLSATRQQLDKASDDDAVYGKQVTDLKAQLAKIQSELVATRLQLVKEITDDKADDATYEKQIAELKSQLSKLQAGDAANAHKITELEAQLKASSALGATMVTTKDFLALKAKYDALSAKSFEGDIERIEGIGPVYGQKLRSAGVAWVRQLLERGCTPEGRTYLAAETGIKRDLILTWVNEADLLRVDGITEDWAELLEVSGVDTVKELRNRVPENLLKKMTETNPTGPSGRYAPSLPDLEEVERWVAQAKVMNVRLTY